MIDPQHVNTHDLSFSRFATPASMSKEEPMFVRRSLVAHVRLLVLALLCGVFHGGSAVLAAEKLVGLQAVPSIAMALP